ncbi:MAG: hypothetical protein IPP08_01630 [Chlorobiota bacterium]|jgi:hypothetical protein|nr:hypothetical protein [Chlorobiota bacterium]QQS66899.1 MAG: hypothetical protein IPP08_01630 [Chlorobiota bacterium]
MKYKLVVTLSFIVFVVSTAIYAGKNGVVFGTMKAVSQGGEVLIQWNTASELGIYSYEIERKSSEVVDFRRIGRIDSKSKGGNCMNCNNNYSYTDNGAFFKNETGKQFIYRIKSVGTNGEQYSQPIMIIHEVSSVKRSWGMIKELFR